MNRWGRDLATGGGEGGGKVVGGEASAERGSARATRFRAGSRQA